MNKEKAEKYRETAKRTLKMIDLLEEGLTDKQIMDKLGVERQLVQYYRTATETPRLDPK